jgi:spore coat polysaccharide biosynthesis predicted glycosyltransferase SpsG
VYELLAPVHGECNVAPQLPDLADALSRADVTICGGGLTKYESAYLGVPAAVLSVNKGQAEDTLAFAARNLGLDLGLAEAVDDSTICRRLEPLLRNAPLRRSLSRSGLDCFPVDPTMLVAEELLALIAR